MDKWFKRKPAPWRDAVLRGHKFMQHAKQVTGENLHSQSGERSCSKKKVEEDSAVEGKF